MRRKNDYEAMNKESDYSYRKASIDDIEIVEKLWEELAKDQMSKDKYFKGDPDQIKASPEQFEIALQTDRCAIFLAEKAGEPVGFIEVWMYDADMQFAHEDYAYILHFFVESDHRMLEIYDICNNLYNRCEIWAKENGKTTIQGDVYYHNDKVKNILINRCDLEVYQTRLVKRLV